jgi:hypothetical protein
MNKKKKKALLGYFVAFLYTSWDDAFQQHKKIPSVKQNFICAPLWKAAFFKMLIPDGQTIGIPV